VLSERKHARNLFQPPSQREGTGGGPRELKLISADFHYSREEDRGTHRVPTKVAGAIKTKIRTWRPPEATTLPRLDTSKRFHPAVAPGIPGAFTNNLPEKERGRERQRDRRESSIRFFCSRRRQDVAPRRADRALESRPPQTHAEDADTLRSTPDGLVSFSIVSFTGDSALRPMVPFLLWTTQ